MFIQELLSAVKSELREDYLETIKQNLRKLFEEAGIKIQPEGPAFDRYILTPQAIVLGIMDLLMDRILNLKSISLDNPIDKIILNYLISKVDSKERSSDKKITVCFLIDNKISPYILIPDNSTLFNDKCELLLLEAITPEKCKPISSSVSKAIGTCVITQQKDNILLFDSLELKYPVDGVLSILSCNERLLSKVQNKESKIQLILESFQLGEFDAKLYSLLNGVSSFSFSRRNVTYLLDKDCINVIFKPLNRVLNTEIFIPIEQLIREEKIVFTTEQPLFAINTFEKKDGSAVKTDYEIFTKNESYLINDLMSTVEIETELSAIEAKDVIGIITYGIQGLGILKESCEVLNNMKMNTFRPYLANIVLPEISIELTVIGGNTIPNLFEILNILEDIILDRHNDMGFRSTDIEAYLLRKNIQANVTINKIYRQIKNKTGDRITIDFEEEQVDNEVKLQKYEAAFILPALIKIENKGQESGQTN